MKNDEQQHGAKGDGAGISSTPKARLTLYDRLDDEEAMVRQVAKPKRDAMSFGMKTRGRLDACCIEFHLTSKTRPPRRRISMLRAAADGGLAGGMQLGDGCLF